MSNQMTIRFWGVRGSYPVPGAETAAFGGNTACVEITAGEETVILDAGTGIVSLGRALLRQSLAGGQPIRATLLFSHMHHDHTQGFPFFTPAYLPGSHLSIFGPNLLGRDVRGVLSQTVSPPVFPLTLNDLPGTGQVRDLSEHEIITLTQGIDPVVGPAGSRTSADALVIRCLRSAAHPGGVSIYRIEWNGRSVVYATDTEGYANLDRRLAKFAQDADLLIHDAQYSDEHYLGLRPGFPATQGYGHSTISMACSLAEAAGARQLVLFHHDPSHEDNILAQLEKTAQAQFRAARTAREGMTVTLKPCQLAAAAADRQPVNLSAAPA